MVISMRGYFWIVYLAIITVVAAEVLSRCTH
jgi:hypothetical protein